MFYNNGCLHCDSTNKKVNAILLHWGPTHVKTKTRQKRVLSVQYDDVLNEIIYYIIILYMVIVLHLSLFLFSEGRRDLYSVHVPPTFKTKSSLWACPLHTLFHEWFRIMVYQHNLSNQHGNNCFFRHCVKINDVRNNVKNWFSFI